jgi:copper chaperone NosL
LPKKKAKAGTAVKKTHHGSPGRRGGAFMKLTIVSTLMFLFFALPGDAQEDTNSHAVCKYCNMDRKAFGYSRMLIDYMGGTSAGTCSLHCTVLDLTTNITLVPCRIRVGDYTSKKLIDAMDAHWVVGGDKSGVMTPRAKWAVENKAEAFTREHGGQLATFFEALAAAYEDLYLDMKTSLERVKERKKQGWHRCDG